MCENSIPGKRSTCFGEESWTYFVFWILLLVNTSGPKICAIISRRRACCNEWWNALRVCFLMFQNTPLFPSLTTGKAKHSPNHTHCIPQQSWPWPASPSCGHRREGKRRAGAGPCGALVPRKGAPTLQQDVALVRACDLEAQSRPGLSSWAQCSCVGHSLGDSGNSMEFGVRWSALSLAPDIYERPWANSLPALSVRFLIWV